MSSLNVSNKGKSLGETEYLPSPPRSPIRFPIADHFKSAMQGLPIDLFQPSDFDITEQPASYSEPEDDIGNYLRKEQVANALIKDCKRLSSIDQKAFKELYEEYRTLDTNTGLVFNKINDILRRYSQNYKHKRGYYEFIEQELRDDFSTKYQNFIEFSLKIPSAFPNFKKICNDKIKLLDKFEENLLRMLETGKIIIIPNPELPA